VNATLVALVVFACVFGAALLGMALHAVLPPEHLGSDSKDVVKLAMGLIATMAALVLGLLTSSAKSTYDAQDAEIKQVAANVIVLDRIVARYGPETVPVRALIRATLERRLEATWPRDGSVPKSLDVDDPSPAVDSVEDRLRALAPQTDEQRDRKARAIEVAGSVQGTRWLLLGQARSEIQMPLLVVLVFWLAALFVSFGLFAPRNATVLVVLLVAAMSVAGSIFLIIELNAPFTGVLKISDAPLRYALGQLGK
jgi:membrane-bound ClpP family serine protease